MSERLPKRRTASRLRPVLDDVKKGQVTAMIAVGCTRRAAANYVGCCVGTIRNTALRDPAFARDLRKSEAQPQVCHLRNIHQAAADARHWRAAAWVLERKYPDHFGVRRARTLTVQQVRTAFGHLAAVVCNEIGDTDCRLRVLRRLKRLSRSLRALAGERRPVHGR